MAAASKKTEDSVDAEPGTEKDNKRDVRLAEAEGADDAGSLAYVVELSQNLQSVSVMVFRPDAPAALECADVRVCVREVDLNVWYRDSQGTSQLKVPLGGADVDGSKATVQILVDHALIKLPLRPSPATSLHNDSHLLEAQKLPSTADLAQLHCRACGESLLVPESGDSSTKPGASGAETLIRRVFSLPSTYWLELADFWTCGNCCAFRQFPTDEIKAAPSVCFVSDTFLMLHSSQVKHALLPPPQDSKPLEGLVSAGSEVGWTPIRCPGCCTPLGVREIPVVEQEHVSVRLFTYRLANQPLLPSRDYFRADTLERFVAKHLLASSAIHTIYRFSVIAFESDKPSLHIVLTNWRSSLASNLPLLQRPDDTVCGLAPVVKLRYVDCSSSAEESTSKDGDDTNNKTGVRVEELVLWQAECDELLQILRERNRTCLPPSVSLFCGLPLSFLFC